MRILLSPTASRTGNYTGAVSQTGFTLIELVIAAALLAALTALATPYLHSPRLIKLQETGVAIADMFRYARDISITTGKPRAVTVAENDDNVFFSVLYDDAGQPTVDRHPVTRGHYAMVVPASPTGRKPGISDAVLTFDGPCNGAVDHMIAFDGHGIPRCVDPFSTMLDSATVELSMGTETIMLSIEPLTGRVTEL